MAARQPFPSVVGLVGSRVHASPRVVSPILGAMEDKVGILRGVPLFAGLDERSLQAVALLAHEVTFNAGDVLMVEGEPGEAFYVIVDGTVRIEQGDRTVRSMTAGGFLGEIALVDRRLRTATATCVTDVRLLEIRAHEFERLVETLPAVCQRIRATIERRIRTGGDPESG